MLYKLRLSLGKNVLILCVRGWWWGGVCTDYGLVHSPWQDHMLNLLFTWAALQLKAHADLSTEFSVQGPDSQDSLNEADSQR